MAQSYTVKPGDTLYSIARQFGLPPEELIRANRLPDPDRLAVGQVLRVPERAALWYVVRFGDTLFSIAKRYFTTVEALLEKNEIADPNVIVPGQRIRIR